MVNFALNENKGFNRKLLMIYTGGTLGMVYDATLETLVPFHFEKILDSIPELGRIQAKLHIVAMEPAIDSSNMQPDIWVEIATIIEDHYSSFDGFVILHGTDTMAYTASALSFMFENLDKPVILTGAQLPIGLARTDARENMMTSLELALDPENVLHDVCIYFNGRLLRGNRAKKYESSQFDAFHSENYPYLADVGVYCQFNYPYLRKKPSGAFSVKKSMDSRVLILKLFPGLRLDFLNHIFEQKELKGIIMETFGSGNASTDPLFLELLKAATDEGKIILNISQCSGGEVRQKDYATGKALTEAGVISGKDLTAEAAVTKFMYLSGQNLSVPEIKKQLQTNLRGEMAG